MIQLAGVGLMLEVVAHELARATESTLQLIDQAPAVNLPEDISGVFKTLHALMKMMNKRLRVLDPLSVSARQRKETFNLEELVQDILDGHKAQFQRHKIKVSVTVRAGRKSAILLHGVKGLFVQIVENLLSNSIYWLNLTAEDQEDFVPKITIEIGPPPIVLTFTDNGPGIQPELREEVFKAFFSTKDRTRRQGLGLFIARDCAQYHEGSLYLSDERTVHKKRLNTCVLEMPEGIKR
jgi:signal transduction histidine kinase